MAWSSRKPCKHPGCPQLTREHYCEEHQAAHTPKPRRPRSSKGRDYVREYKQRDPEINKRYNAAWRRIRNRYITAHPLCANCQRQGRLVPATEVDHIKPLANGGTHAMQNLQSLCKSCHSGKTALERAFEARKTGGY